MMHLPVFEEFFRDLTYPSLRFASVDQSLDSSLCFRDRPWVGLSLQEFLLFSLEEACAC